MRLHYRPALRDLATWRRWIRRHPVDGTKRTHGPERDHFKACVLGVQYGMGAASLAGRIGKPSPFAVELLRLHRETYPSFWAWSEGPSLTPCS